MKHYMLLLALVTLGAAACSAAPAERSAPGNLPSPTSTPIALPSALAAQIVYAQQTSAAAQAQQAQIEAQVAMATAQAAATQGAWSQSMTQTAVAADARATAVAVQVAADQATTQAHAQIAAAAAAATATERAGRATDIAVQAHGTDVALAQQQTERDQARTAERNDVLSRIGLGLALAVAGIAAYFLARMAHNWSRSSDLRRRTMETADGRLITLDYDKAGHMIVNVQPAQLPALPSASGYGHAFEADDPPDHGQSNIDQIGPVTARTNGQVTSRFRLSGDPKLRKDRHLVLRALSAAMMVAGPESNRLPTAKTMQAQEDPQLRFARETWVKACAMLQPTYVTRRITGPPEERGLYLTGRCKTIREMFDHVRRGQAVLNEATVVEEGDEGAPARGEGYDYRKYHPSPPAEMMPAFEPDM